MLVNEEDLITKLRIINYPYIYKVCKNKLTLFYSEIHKYCNKVIICNDNKICSLIIILRDNKYTIFIKN